MSPISKNRCCIKDCERSAHTLGLCTKHWRRNKRYGSPLALRAFTNAFIGLPSEARFSKQVKKTASCWEWIGAKDQDGYGAFKAEVGGVRYLKAHRYSWVIHTGELITEELVVLHECDNPSCVNPSHLSVGTVKDNVHDMMGKGRHLFGDNYEVKKAIKLSVKDIDVIVLDSRPHGIIANEYAVTAKLIKELKKEHSGKTSFLEPTDYNDCCIRTCKEMVFAEGMCQKHHGNNKEFGSPVADKPHSGMFIGKSSIQRFKMQVKMSDGCWLWLGGCDKDGYGQFRGSVGGKVYGRAHRFSYVYFHKETIGKEDYVCHACDNPPCVNPDHLFVGTARENIEDMMKKGRHWALKGEEAPNAKLSEDDVLKILKDPRPDAALANQYGVAVSTISGIKRRIRWQSVNVSKEEVVRGKKAGNPGEKHYSTNLTESDVREIRSKKLAGKDLAVKFNVSRATICDIQKRRSWKHVK